MEKGDIRGDGENKWLMKVLSKKGEPTGPCEGPDAQGKAESIVKGDLQGFVS